MNLDKFLEEYNRQIPLYDLFREKLHSITRILTFNDENVLFTDSGIKSLESVTQKLLRKNVKSISEIDDLIGIRIIVADQNSLNEVLRKFQMEFTIVETNENNQWLDESRYQNVHFIIKIDSERARFPEWNLFQGLKAEIQIRSVFAQAWLDFEHLINYKSVTIEPLMSSRLKVLTALEEINRFNEIIDEFEKLLEKPDLHEKRDIHPFINENRFLLHSNPEEIWSEVPLGLGTEFRIDFLIRKADGDFILVEIENARHNLFTKAGDLTAPVNHALGQVEDWQDWIEDNLSTVQKKYPGIMSPEGLVIIGRSKNLSIIEKQKLRRKNINMRGNVKIITYDDLIANARAFVEFIRKNLQK